MYLFRVKFAKLDIYHIVLSSVFAMSGGPATGGLKPASGAEDKKVEEFYSDLQKFPSPEIIAMFRAYKKVPAGFDCDECGTPVIGKWWTCCKVSQCKYNVCSSCHDLLIAAFVVNPGGQQDTFQIKCTRQFKDCSVTGLRHFPDGMEGPQVLLSQPFLEFRNIACQECGDLVPHVNVCRYPECPAAQVCDECIVDHKKYCKGLKAHPEEEHFVQIPGTYHQSFDPARHAAGGLLEEPRRESDPLNFFQGLKRKSCTVTMLVEALIILWKKNHGKQLDHQVVYCYLMRMFYEMTFPITFERVVDKFNVMMRQRINAGCANAIPTVGNERVLCLARCEVIDGTFRGHTWTTADGRTHDKLFYQPRSQADINNILTEVEKALMDDKKVVCAAVGTHRTKEGVVKAHEICKKLVPDAEVLVDKNGNPFGMHMVEVLGLRDGVCGRLMGLDLKWTSSDRLQELDVDDLAATCFYVLSIDTEYVNGFRLAGPGVQYERQQYLNAVREKKLTKDLEAARKTHNDMVKSLKAEMAASKEKHKAEMAESKEKHKAEMAESNDEIKKLQAEIERLKEAKRNSAEENRRLRRIVESVGKQCSEIAQESAAHLVDSSSEDEGKAAQSKKSKSNRDGSGGSGGSGESKGGQGGQGGKRRHNDDDTDEGGRYPQRDRTLTNFMAPYHRH